MLLYILLTSSYFLLLTSGTQELAHWDCFSLTPKVTLSGPPCLASGSSRALKAYIHKFPFLTF